MTDIPNTPSPAAAVPVPASIRNPPAPPAKKTAAADDHSLASVIDTIEAIIIALIIALTFRAFIVEAFVIPTGSMAPTLLGAHFKVTCPACGYEYDRNANLNFQLRSDGKTRFIPNSADINAELSSNRTVPADEVFSDHVSNQNFCPNCAFPITPEQFPQFLQVAKDVRDGRTGGAPRSIPMVWANNGDRILVLKYLYSFLEPTRFDVIVFKEPQNAQNNYIKRLIGLPGETVQVIGGDVFVAPAGKTSPADMQIARKPDHIQSALWQLVYNNDYYPVDEGRPRSFTVNGYTTAVAPWINPWVPTEENRWTKGTAMTLSGPGPGSLRFHNRRPYGHNTLGYNSDAFADPPSEETLFPVGDLRLETLWAPATSDSANAVTLTLGRPDNLFRVTWNGTNVILQRFDAGSQTFQNVATTPHGEPVSGQAYRLALDNVDHAINFWIDGKKVVSHQPAWTAQDAHTEAQIRDSQNRTLALDPQISLDVSGPCALSHLKIFRDLYYTPGNYPQTATSGPLTLKQDEFFAMGDNSRKSSDGRMWATVFPPLDDLATRPGIVPRRYLLGKAFFVYWPAGYRATSNESVPLLKDLPLVPNTGSMRMIR